MYRTNVEVPTPGEGEVLIRVGAAGVNNTDINTRIGWYSKSVTTDTGDGGSGGFSNEVDDDGGWAGEPLQFPRIQGADVAGEIVAVGPGVDPSRIGKRVMTRTMQSRATADNPVACITLGSERDGGFSQFMVNSSKDALAVESNLTNVELASFPCAYSTAEGLIHRAGVASGDRVLITGASGGVGSAAIQLCKRRGAEIVAVASTAKHNEVRAAGADEAVDRNADLLAEVGESSCDVVIDVVAGPGFGSLLDVLKPGGTYATAGAIAGPIVDLDVRTLYLKDLTMIGCTFQPDIVFENLVRYIEAGEITPLVAATYPLAEIEAAQRNFLTKSFVGKLVLVPPAMSSSQ